ncbi:helix-turn-helix domain-containing protein [Nonomuraea rubra]|uniref:helix-turn-helix domain-containing protein n=1 Tax=Nonomuraea rubra TaxID=46180 RepID=UPI003410C971
MSDQSAKNGRSEGTKQDRRQALPIPEVAEMLGVSPMTVRRAVDSGEFPHVSVRSKRLVPKAFVEALLAAPRWGAEPQAEVAV